MNNEQAIPKKTRIDYWHACQFLDQCRTFGFELDRLIDRDSKDIEAAERLLAFVDCIENGIKTVRD